MAMTETKSGFRPPWSSDRNQPNDRAHRPRIEAHPEPARTDGPTLPAATDDVLGSDVTSPDQQSETDPMIETAPGRCRSQRKQHARTRWPASART